MAKKQEKEGQKSFWTTLPGIFTGVAAVLTAVGGIIAALNTAGVFDRPAAPTLTIQAPTDTPTLAEIPTVTSTPLTPPNFVTQLIYDLKDPYSGIEQVALDFQPGIAPEETKTEFLQVSYLAFVTLEDTTDVALHMKLVLTNTSSNTLLLDLDKRFFSVEDSQGRTAELVYFCCATKGEMLRPGQQREMQMFFRVLPDWLGKGVGVDNIFINVRGLLPVVFSSWRVPIPQTAD